MRGESLKVIEEEVLNSLSMGAELLNSPCRGCPSSEILALPIKGNLETNI